MGANSLTSSVSLLLRSVDLHLYVQSVSIATIIVSSIPDHDECTPYNDKTKVLLPQAYVTLVKNAVKVTTETF